MQQARKRKFLPSREILETKFSISKRTFTVISPLEQQFEKCTFPLNLEQLPFLSIIFKDRTSKLRQSNLKEVYLQFYLFVWNLLLCVREDDGFPIMNLIQGWFIHHIWEYSCLKLGVPPEGHGQRFPPKSSQSELLPPLPSMASFSLAKDGPRGFADSGRCWTRLLLSGLSRPPCSSKTVTLFYLSKSRRLGVRTVGRGQNGTHVPLNACRVMPLTPCPWRTR